MPQKFCPFAFFSFYVNKNSAEAGGCHHCVEDACALWDENYEQCSLKSAVESIGVIADSFSTTNLTIGNQEKLPVKEIKTGVSDLFSRLREKKKLAVIGENEAIKTNEIKKEELPKVEAILNPATIVETESITPKVEQKSTVPVTPGLEQKKAVPALEQKTLATGVEQKKLVTIPAIEQKQTAPVVKTNPIIEEASKQLAELSELNELNDDFSDLLNPPPIDVANLPVVSFKEKDGVRE